MESVVLGIFGSLSVLAFVVNLVQSAKGNAGPKEDVQSNEARLKFKKLQYKFFGAYFLAVFGDWLQGPYVYQLYAKYGFAESQIALLFLTGFASSSTFGTFSGPMADKYGRKKMAMMFCIIYSFCCVIKLVNNFWILLMGRIMGGVSTSLLFSVFESWYVKEHVDVQKLNPKWLSRTFSTTTFANGLLAILAGLVANFSAETLGYGPVAPFMIAVACFALCLVVIIATWDENYGNPDSHLLQSYKEGLSLIMNHRHILFLGLVQSIVESCMYIFVFLWTPVMSDGVEGAPLGLIFSSFMVAIMLGSSYFSYLVQKDDTTPKDTLHRATTLFCLATFVSSITAGPGSSYIIKIVTLCTFIALEFSIGLYFPSIGCLRGEFIPESHRATVTNWFRVPMNLITCVTLLAVNHPAVAKDKRSIFATCTGLLITGVLICAKFRSLTRGLKRD
ncbi:hypothetical protein TCAL_08927 [Tigriopus californicus]|uniref:Molybdate-anion transporter n=1 Tax=Tigriopus californicus TaxID=6832 RepID=A0A553PP60_TIGCA|nr:molybdate-anion transporter-like [Tigriopus californicus]TRY79466.1 hypothetical protein TCAL_08927 [Tigriopus californicus]|eukprot:TCALIF_08927-PA protein Name:"Similar to MFSD5 Molybdate-anion transporter (Homo sapiens)" AED:0.07 eAED:0.07 QI:68/0.33/0.25/1/0.66/0.75/4/0/446